MKYNDSSLVGIKTDDYGVVYLRTEDGYLLFRTCIACPEQYDVTYYDSQVAYLRLRHGNFTVSCPDVGGDLIYKASPKGDGIFDDSEREFYLRRALTAIREWNLQQKLLGQDMLSP
ncbi:MAG: hypothetical protein AB7F64_09205 [Gammaproteobacteria bacterium]